MPDIEVRCDLTELPTSMCSHCRGHDTRVTAAGSGSFGRPFTAAHYGRCGICDSSYDEGDRIRKDLERNSYVHEECADEIEGSGD